MKLLHWQKVRHIHHSAVAAYQAMTYGKGFLGALGHKSFDDVTRPKPLETLAGVSCMAVDVGWGHTAFLTDDGTIAVAGRPFDFKQTLRNINIRGGLPALQSLMTWAQQGMGDVEPQVVPIPAGSLLEGDAPMHITCSSGSLTAVLTRYGFVLSFGSNAFGQTGTGHANADEVVEVPTLLVGLPEWERVAGLALGMEHALAVTRSGALYSWGRGDRGQLGLGDGDKGRFKSAVRIVGPEGSWLTEVGSPSFVAVEGGTSFSVALDTRGRAWIWGKMQSLLRGEARGDGYLYLDQATPRRIYFTGEGGLQEEVMEDNSQPVDRTEAPAPPSPEAVAQDQQVSAEPALRARNVAPNATHGTDALLTRADTLPLALAVPIAAEWDPFSVPARVAVLSAGHAHVSLLTSDGRLWMMGLRGRGVGFDSSPTDAAAHNRDNLPTELDPNAAVPEVFAQTEPMPVPPGTLAGKRVRALRSDLHYSYALTEDGRVFRWGWRGIVMEVEETAGVLVTDVAFGFAHMALLGSRT